MKTLHQHDSESCTFLGTVDNQDLYFSEQGGFGATVIARYGSDGPDYFSGLCFSKEGILRIAAERAIEKGLLTREEWRSKVYKLYFPYSHVKSLMLMSTNELWELVYEKRGFLGRKDLEVIFNILERREQA